MPWSSQPGGGFVDLLARQAIDDACFAAMFGEEGQQLPARIVAFDDAVADVGAVEAGDEDARATPAPRRSTISPRVSASAVAVSAMRGTARESARAGSESWMYSGRKSWPHCETQCASSMANRAMRRAACSRSSRSRKRSVQQAFRRDIEQVEIAAQQTLVRSRRRRRQSSVELRKAAVTPSLAQGVHLVLHQRDQRRDDDADAGPQQRGQSGSTATCRRRSASAPARRHRLSGGRRSRPAGRERPDSRRLSAECRARSLP